MITVRRLIPQRSYSQKRRYSRDARGSLPAQNWRQDRRLTLWCSTPSAYGNLTRVSSPVPVIQSLVEPIRDGNAEIELQYRGLFAYNATILFAASYQVFEDAAQLRARPV